jgi:hypothetical protein
VKIQRRETNAQKKEWGENYSRQGKGDKKIESRDTTVLPVVA